MSSTGFRPRPFLLLLLPGVLFFLSSLTHARPARADARIVEAGRQAVTLSNVFKIGDNVYFSAPELFHALGFSFTWQARTEKLVARKDEQSLVIMPGTNHVISGSKTWRLSTPPRFISGTLCVPVEFVQRTIPVMMDLKISIEHLDPQSPPPLGPLLRRAENIKRVVLDPGHGGHDLGAKSPQGIYEKDINLAIALKLRGRLERDMGVEVVLTRDGDYFVPLSGRTGIGNRADADLFMAIHANGSPSHKSSGLETYFLSFEASDRQAARLAEEENKSVQFDPDSPFAQFGGEDDLKAILIDTVSTENMKASEKLAAAVQRRLVQSLDLPNRGVKQAPFFVLVGSRIPAILVEVGFVSNPEEASRLASPRTQDEIADALFKAISYYDETLSH